MTRRDAKKGEPVIASEAKQSSFTAAKLDCFVAVLLAMTRKRQAYQQARNAPSPTMWGCCASDTAGDVRITSACAPKMATAR
jgi:hypothetical protein